MVKGNTVNRFHCTGFGTSCVFETGGIEGIKEHVAGRHYDYFPYTCVDCFPSEGSPDGKSNSEGKKEMEGTKLATMEAVHNHVDRVHGKAMKIMRNSDYDQELETKLDAAIEGCRYSPEAEKRNPTTDITDNPPGEILSDFEDIFEPLTSQKVSETSTQKEESRWNTGNPKKHTKHLSKQIGSETSNTCSKKSSTLSIPASKQEPSVNIQDQFETTPEDSNKSCNTGGHSDTVDKTMKQLSKLEQAYEIDPYPNSKRRTQLANELSLTEKRVRFWFMHRRKQIKKQNFMNYPPVLLTKKTDILPQKKLLAPLDLVGIPETELKRQHSGVAAASSVSHMTLVDQSSHPHPAKPAASPYSLTQNMKTESAGRESKKANTNEKNKQIKPAVKLEATPNNVNLIVGKRKSTEAESIGIVGKRHRSHMDPSSVPLSGTKTVQDRRRGRSGGLEPLPFDARPKIPQDSHSNPRLDARPEYSSVLKPSMVVVQRIDLQQFGIVSSERNSVKLRPIMVREGLINATENTNEVIEGPSLPKQPPEKEMRLKKHHKQKDTGTSVLDPSVLLRGTTAFADLTDKLWTPIEVTSAVEREVVDVEIVKPDIPFLPHISSIDRDQRSDSPKKDPLPQNGEDIFIIREKQKGKKIRKNSVVSKDSGREESQKGNQHTQPTRSAPNMAEVKMETASSLTSSGSVAKEASPAPTHVNNNKKSDHSREIPIASNLNKTFSDQLIQIKKKFIENGSNQPGNSPACPLCKMVTTDINTHVRLYHKYTKVDRYVCTHPLGIGRQCGFTAFCKDDIDIHELKTSHTCRKVSTIPSTYIGKFTKHLRFPRTIMDVTDGIEERRRTINNKEQTPQVPNLQKPKKITSEMQVSVSITKNRFPSKPMICRLCQARVPWQSEIVLHHVTLHWSESTPLLQEIAAGTLADRNFRWIVVHGCDPCRQRGTPFETYNLWPDMDLHGEKIHAGFWASTPERKPVKFNQLVEVCFPDYKFYRSDHGLSPTRTTASTPLTSTPSTFPHSYSFQPLNIQGYSVGLRRNKVSLSGPSRGDARITGPSNRPDLTSVIPGPVMSNDGIIGEKNLTSDQRVNLSNCVLRSRMLPGSGAKKPNRVKVILSNNKKFLILSSGQKQKVPVTPNATTTAKVPKLQSTAVLTDDPLLSITEGASVCPPTDAEVVILSDHIPKGISNTTEGKKRSSDEGQGLVQPLLPVPTSEFGSRSVENVSKNKLGSDKQMCNDSAAADPKSNTEVSSFERGSAFSRNTQSKSNIPVAVVAGQVKTTVTSESPASPPDVEVLPSPELKKRWVELLPKRKLHDSDPPKAHSHRAEESTERINMGFATDLSLQEQILLQSPPSGGERVKFSLHLKPQQLTVLQESLLEERLGQLTAFGKRDRYSLHLTPAELAKLQTTLGKREDSPSKHQPQTPQTSTSESPAANTMIKVSDVPMTLNQSLKQRLPPGPQKMGPPEKTSSLSESYAKMNQSIRFASSQECLLCKVWVESSMFRIHAWSFHSRIPFATQLVPVPCTGDPNCRHKVFNWDELSAHCRRVHPTIPMHKVVILLKDCFPFHSNIGPEGRTSHIKIQ